MSTTLLLDFLGAFIDSHTIFTALAEEANDALQADQRYLSLPEMLAKTGHRSKSAVLKKLNRLIQDKPLAFQPFAPLLDCLSILKQAGFQFGLLAPRLHACAQHICDANDIDLFDFIESDSSFFNKEYALNRAMKKHQLKPGSFCYLSGNLNNIQIAQQDKILTIANGWGMDALEDLQKAHPTYTIVKPGELLTVMTEQLVSTV